MALHSRRLHFALPLLGGTLVLASCGAGTASPEGTAEPGSPSGEVTMRVYPLLGEGDQEFWAGHIAAFQEEYPDVEVRVDVQPWAEREQSLTTAIAGGAAPDIAYMVPDELGQFVAQGVVEPLTDRLEQDGYRQNALDAVTIDGELYGAPILTSAIPGVCDGQVLEQAGIEAPPTTWDELMEMGPKLKENGHYATHFIAANESTLNTTFYPWVWQAGGSVFEEDGTPNFDSPEAAEALQFLVDLSEAGFVSADEVTVNPPLEQTPVGRREVACIYYMDPIYVEPLWGEDTVVAPPLSNKTDTIYGTVGSYALLNTSENKDAATAWLNFITSPDVMSDLDKQAGYYPPREDATVEFPEGSVQAEVGKYVDNTDAGPVVAGAREAQGVVAPEIQAAVLGSKTVEQALADAQSAAESVLAKN